LGRWKSLLLPLQLFLPLHPQPIENKRTDQLATMWNVHAISHRITALSMAFLSTGAVILCSMAGFGCSFVEINAEPDRNLMTPGGEVLSGSTVEMLGVTCDDSPFYEDVDRFWNLSRIFLYVSVGFGGLTGLIAWALSTFVPPTKCNWRFLSILAAITAVMQVPIFLLFESEPCNMDINRQTCSVGLGSYFNIASVSIWVVMTLWMQFLNPPKWNEEGEQNWKTSDRRMHIHEISVPSEETTTYESASPNATDKSESPKNKNVLLVASSNDSLAVWTMGNRTNATKKSRRPEELAMNVSSLDAGETRDLEVGHGDEPQGNNNERVSAAAPESTLQREPVLHNSESSQQHQSFEVAADDPLVTQHFPSPSFFHDGDSSTTTDKNPGMRVTIICPDGSREETKFGTPSCFVSPQQLMGLDEPEPEPEILQPPPMQAMAETHIPTIPNTRSLIDDEEEEEDDDDGPIDPAQIVNVPVRQRQRPDACRKVPVSTLNIQRKASEGLSEMSESAFTGQSEGVNDVLGILEDLARTY